MRRSAVQHALFVALTAFVALVAWPCDADAGTIILLNGEEIRGEVLAVTTRDVSVRQPAGMVRIALEQVEDILDQNGKSIYARAVGTAHDRMTEELAREAEERRLRRLGLTEPEPEEPAPAEDEYELEPPPEVPTVSFRGAYQSSMHGFRLSHPVGWHIGRDASDYYKFQDPSPGYKGWSFNVTVFESFEAGIESIRDKARAELESLAGHHTLKRWWSLVDGRPGERTTGMFERDGLVIRHEQVIVESGRGNVLLLHFFVPAGSSEAVPEIEAVLRSLELGKDPRARSKGASQRGGRTKAAGTRRSRRDGAASSGFSGSENAAVSSLRTIVTAQALFYSKRRTYADSLPNLTDAGEAMLDSALASGVRDGYRFSLRALGRGFSVTAIPLSGRGRSFFVDETGLVRFAKNGDRPTPSSPAIGSR